MSGGLKEQAGQAAARLLETREALDVINGEMIPALDRVARDLKKGTIFLPQLLMSAEAAKAAFEVVKSRMEGQGSVEKKGKIILATGEGGYPRYRKEHCEGASGKLQLDVLDLGRDVPPETVVETAVREHVPLVGLSALMTTTVPSMEETIRQLRETAPGVRVMVGGAVLTSGICKEHRGGCLLPGRHGVGALCGDGVRQLARNFQTRFIKIYLHLYVYLFSHDRSQKEFF